MRPVSPSSMLWPLVNGLRLYAGILVVNDPAWRLTRYPVGSLDYAHMRLPVAHHSYAARFWPKSVRWSGFFCAGCTPQTVKIEVNAQKGCNSLRPYAVLGVDCPVCTAVQRVNGLRSYANSTKIDARGVRTGERWTTFICDSVAMPRCAKPRRIRALRYFEIALHLPKVLPLTRTGAASPLENPGSP